MNADIDGILELLMPEYVNKLILMRHDEAREAFRAESTRVPDHQVFARRVAEYVQHHRSAVKDGRPSLEAAFGEARRILNGVFGEDPFQEGYTVALQMGRSGAGGGMRAIYNTLADQLKRQALNNYKDYVFNSKINVLSQTDNMVLAQAYFGRFGQIIRRFLPDMDERTFASNVRAALEYHLQVVEEILRVARKM